jgi:hypothetical protein
MQSSSFYELDSHLSHYPEIQVIENKKVNAFRLDSLIETEGLLHFHDLLNHYLKKK